MSQKESAIEFKIDPLIAQWNKLACSDYIHDLSWSRNGFHLACADATGHVTVLTTLNGYPLERWMAHALGALRVRYSHDGNFIASSGQDGKAHIYELSEYSKLATIDHGNDAWVEHIAWHRTSDYILSAAGKRLKLNKLDGSLIQEFEDHKSTIADVSWNPAAPDLFATSSYNGVRLWNMNQTNHKRHLEWKGSLLNIAYSPNAKIIATGCQDQAAHVWLLPSGEDLFMNGYPTKVRELSWDSTSRFLATGGGPDVIVWDFSGKGPSGSKPVILPGHEGFVSVLAFAPKGLRLASGGTDGQVMVWDLANRGHVLANKEDDSPVTNLVWSGDGTKLAASFASGRLALFDL